MAVVKLESPKKEIMLHSIAHNCIVAYHSPNGGNPICIQMQQNGKWGFKSLLSPSSGSLSYDSHSPNRYDSIENAISNGREVHAFETQEEFAEWMQNTLLNFKKK